MSFEAWTIFALFWVVFVTTPGPNAVNCIQNGMHLGFGRAMVGVLAILTQATLFLILSAFGIIALIAASPQAFFIAKLIGAGVLIYLGIKGWMAARTPVTVTNRPAKSIYFQALVIATINPKSVAGYLAAFSQFVQPDAPIWEQMVVIMPTALTLTALSYTGFTALGAGLGRAALDAVFSVWLRRILASCFVAYGVLLGSQIHRGAPDMNEICVRRCVTIGLKAAPLGDRRACAWEDTYFSLTKRMTTKLRTVSYKGRTENG